MPQTDLDLKILFVKWLDDQFEELTKKGSKVAYAYEKALHNIRAFEGNIGTPRQLNGIQYVGAKLVKFLCNRLKKHCKENSIEIPVEFENYVGDTQGGKRHHELDAEVATKKKKATAWVPKRRGGSWAILISLYTTDRARNGLQKEDIISGAEKYCDKAFTSNPSVKEYYSAWDGIKTLVKRGLVTEYGRPKAYVITDEGAQMASVIIHQEGIQSSPAKPVDMSFDNGIQVSPESSAIRSDGYSRSRLQVFDYDYSSPLRVSRQPSYGNHNLQPKASREPSYSSQPAYSNQPAYRIQTAYESPADGNATPDVLFLSEDEDDIHAFDSATQFTRPTRASPAPYAPPVEKSTPARKSISPDKAVRHRLELGPPKANPYMAEQVEYPRSGFIQRYGSLYSSPNGSQEAKQDPKTAPSNAHTAPSDPKNSTTDPAHDPLHDAKNKTYMGIPYSVWAPEEYDVVILLDSREVRSRTERDFFERQISNRGTLCDVRALSVGDVLWVARHKHTKKEVVLNYICERKRIDDLAGSIKDGRFIEQKARLKKSGTKNIHYLVEESGQGDAQRVVDMKTSLETSISMVITVSNFYMQRFKRTDDTIDWLVTMTDVLKERYQKVRLLQLKPRHISSQDEYLRVLLAFRKKFETRKTTYECAHTFTMFQESLVKSNLMTVKEMFIKMLMLVRGISFEKALMIQRHFKTPKALIEHYIRNDGLGEAEKTNLIFNIFQDEVGAKKINKAALVAMYEAWGKAVCEG